MDFVYITFRDDDLDEHLLECHSTCFAHKVALVTILRNGILNFS